LAKSSAAYVRNISIVPTLERSRQDPIHQVEKSVADEHGAISFPFRIDDILLRLEIDEVITAEERAAGEDFREQFNRAQFVGLRAMDWSRPMVSGGRAPEFGNRVELARDRVNKALLLVGGRTSLAGSCLWAVLGWGDRLCVWCREYNLAHPGATVTRYRAKKILVGALRLMAQAREGRERKMRIHSFRNEEPEAAHAEG